MTSRDVVNVVQRRIGKRRLADGSKVKVGHAGTLDPLAEGVLVLGVGRAVRLVPYVQQQPKHYLAKFLLGKSSVSGDLENGADDHPQLPIPTHEQLDAAAAKLVGSITQTPPAHSAIWIDGKRAHQRIRAGEVVEMPTRIVRIDQLRIVAYDFPELQLDIVCGSGTYIRTLGLDFALAAGSTAVMSHLKRQAVGDFVHQESVSIDRLRNEDLTSLLLPPEMAVTHLPQIIVDHHESVRIGHGLDIGYRIDAGEPSDAEKLIDEAVAIDADGRLRGIVQRRGESWFPKRVFPIDERVGS